MSKHHVVELSRWETVKVTTLVSDQEGPIVNKANTSQLPEAVMIKLAAFTGDARATVAVGGALAQSNYGNKAETHVTVKVTCGNTEAEIKGAHEIARGLCEELLTENFERVASLYAELCGEAPAGSFTKAHPPKPLPTPAEPSSSGKPMFKK